MKARKLSNRIMLAYAGMFLAVFILLGCLVVLATWNSLLSGKREYIVNLASIVSAHVLEEHYEGDDVSNPEVLREQSFDLKLNLILYDSDGRVINRTRNFLMDDADIVRAPVSVLVRSEHGGLLLCLTVPVDDVETDLGTLTAVLSLDNEYGYVKNLAAELLIASVAGVLLAAFVGSIVTKRLLKPISDIVVEADSIGADSMEKRLAVPKADDELRMLANTLNRMLERVQRAYDDQARFSSDASHELRTPITVISGYAEMLDRWGKKDPAVLDEGIASIKKQALYMEKLTDELLQLARGGSARPIEKEQIDMSELITENLRQFGSAHPEHSFVNSCADETLFADRTIVTEILYALLDNACKYTPPGGTVTVFADCHGLSVSDTGVGMNEEQLTHVFDRFYRVDKARSRKNGSLGLGLSIVKELCALHGGTASIESAPGKGTTVKTVLHP